MIEMKYIELDYERDVIRVYRPLNISPTNYLTMKVLFPQNCTVNILEVEILQFIGSNK